MTTDRFSPCPSALAHSDPDIHGRCMYCTRKIGQSQSIPMMQRRVRSELTLAYNYYYDPDYGNDNLDCY